MPPRRRPLPPRLRRVFTLGEARAAGVSEKRLRAGDLLRLAPGIFAPAGRPVEVTDVVGALCRALPGVAAFGPTAAEVLGLPLPRRVLTHETQVLHMASPEHRRSSRLVQWHRIDLGPEVLFGADGVRVSSRPRTWCDLGASLPLDDLVSVADHLVRRPRLHYEGRRAPYATLDELAGLLSARPGLRGATRARTALTLARVGSDSPAETAVRLALERAALPAPRLNEAAQEGDVQLGTPDLSWPDRKVCLEHEGPRHRTKEQQARDILRTERRERHGWIEIRTVAEDLRAGGSRAVLRVTDALRRHGWNG